MKKCLFFLIVLFTAVSFAQADLIAHYSMEETSGAIVDQVGGETAEPVDAGHVYAVSGAPSWGNAVAMTANGSWQLDDADSAQLYNLENDFTVTAWVYVDSALLASKTGDQANNDRVIGDDVAWDGDAWCFGLRGGSIIFTKNGIVDAVSAAAPAQDEWAHIAAVVNSSTGIEFYLNGVKQDTNGNTANCNLGNDVFALGRGYGNAQAQWFAGRIDEVRVYDNVLTEAEIADLLDSGNTAGLVSPPNGGTTIPVDTPLEWSAPTVLVPDSYTLNMRLTDANWLDTSNTSVTVDVTSPFSVSLERDTTYFWKVDSVKDGETYPGSTWSFTTVLSIPEIEAGMPVDVLTDAGEDVMFEVSATNPFTLDDTGMTYQWYKAPGTTLSDGEKYAGATSDTLTVIGAAVEDEGGYFCRVKITATGATADSETATLAIKRLIGHWPFEGNLTDVVGGNDGTVGDPNFAEGVIGDQAADFYGDDPVIIPTDALTTASWSLSWWEKSDPTAGGSGVWETMVGSGAGASGWDDFEFGRVDGYRYAFGFNDGGGQYLYTPTDPDAYPRDIWHHLAIAYDAETGIAVWYINGVAFTEFTGRDSSLNDTISIGNVVGDTDQQYTGRIDELKLYNYPIDATEAAEAYTEVYDVVICAGTIVGDFNDDCKVDSADLALMAEAWLQCNLIPLCL